MGVKVSDKTKAKISQKHHVNECDIRECFANRLGNYLTDTREEHRTTPPTLWFIAETNSGRKLKVVFVRDGEDVCIKTAYEPNQMEIGIYNTHAN